MSFFFLAEDGIRVRTVTGVQTCALPISSARQGVGCPTHRRRYAQAPVLILVGVGMPPALEDVLDGDQALEDATLVQDRKSTRLNSSHRTISYAVFCLKKKK